MAWAERISGSKSWRGGWRTPDNKKHYTSRKTHPEHPYARKTDALQAAREAEVRAQRQASVEAGVLAATITWSEWWDVSKPQRPDSDTGRTEYDIVEKYLRPRWGAEPLNKITQKLVQKWVTEELKPGRKPRYARRIYSVFSASLNRAVSEEVLSASPCVRIELPRINKTAKPYTTEAHLTAITSSNGDRPNLPDSGHRDLVVVGYETGLRPGELCGLHASQVDLDSGWVDVTYVYLRRTHTIRPWPKDKDARRVPLTAKALEILRHRLEDRQLANGCGLSHTDDGRCRSALVFLSDRGTPISIDALYRAMTRSAERAGVPSLSPYANRRGFSTWAAEGGMDAFALAAILGHADLDETQGYVQQTSAVRDRLRAARGEPAGLTVVTGAHDHESRGRPGADLTKQAAGDCRIEGVEDAV